MNLCIFMGRLTQEPLVTRHARTTGEQFDCLNNSIAIDNGKDKNGDKLPTTFIDFSVYDKTAQTLAKYAKKGGRIAIQGSLETKTYFSKKSNENVTTLKLNVNKINILDYKEVATYNNTAPQDFKTQYVESIKTRDERLANANTSNVNNQAGNPFAEFADLVNIEEDNSFLD